MDTLKGVLRKPGEGAQTSSGGFGDKGAVKSGPKSDREPLVSTMTIRMEVILWWIN